MSRPLGPTLHTVRAATALASPRPAYAAGIRAAVATVVPLVCAHMLGLAGGGTWMSLGGFSGALADRGGPYRTRAVTMGAVTLCCAAALVLGTLASGDVALAIPLTFAMGFATSLGRAWGTPGVSVGVATLTAFVIALAIPPAAGNGAIARAGFEVIGGLWAMAIALGLWPLQPYRPARLAVAQSYRALAAYTADVALHLRATPATDTSELPAGSAAVRGALEHARVTLTQSRRGRPGTSGREERLVVLGEIVDQLFGHVVAMAETEDSIHAVARISAADAAIVAALDDITHTAHAIAAAVEAERDAEPIVVSWSGQAVRGAMAAAPTSNPAAMVHYEQAAAVLDRAAQYAGVAAVTVAALNEGRADLPAGAAASAVIAEPDEPDAPLTTLRAVLSWDSLIFRYALRVAVVTSVAVALGELLGLKHGYWMTITVIVILQPYTGLTAQRAVQRVVGTVLGGLLTAALGALFHDPRAIFVLTFVFAAACVALLPVNYAAFSAFLTPTFVLLAEASTGDWHLASTRVINTLLGGALALAGSWLLWPSPEKTRLPGFMAAALRANRDYLDRVVALFDDRSESAGHALRQTRRRIGLATVNAEESFQRLLGESSGSGGRLASAMTFLTYTRRLTASIAALALARHTEPGGSETLRAFTQTATGVLADLAESVETGREPAPLPTVMASESARAREAGMPALLRARQDRLARQIRLLHDAVARWITRREPDPAPP
jgi:uncharacterized membrane protein YccC